MRGSSAGLGLGQTVAKRLRLVARARADQDAQLAGAFTAFAQAMTKAGLKPGKTPTAAQLAQIEAAAKSFSTPKSKATRFRAVSIR